MVTKVFKSIETLQHVVKCTHIVTIECSKPRFSQDIPVFPKVGIMLSHPLPCSCLCMLRLCQIASPDASVERASDLGVRGGRKDLGVAGLAVVGPARGHGVADAVKTRERWDLAEPATNEDVLEVGRGTWSQDLSHSARVELVDHRAVAVLDGLESVGLERVVFRELGHAHLLSPFVDDGHVARVAGAGDCGCGSSGRR